jgi:hypothetical protein
VAFAAIAGNLIPCQWDLQSVYTMIDTGVWDDACRKSLDDALVEDRVVDGFTLMLFGGAYTTSRAELEKMFNRDAYLTRARGRLDATELHKSVRVALQKALGQEQW